MVIRSAYFLHDEKNSPPQKPLIKLIKICKEKQISLINHYNDNAYHIIWESTNTNNKDKKLLEFLAASNLEILNRIHLLNGDEKESFFILLSVASKCRKT